MKTNIKYLAAALFTTAVLTSSVLADAPLPQRPEYTQQVTRQTVQTTATKHTIATYTERKAQAPAPRFYLPHNIANGSL